MAMKNLYALVFLILFMIGAAVTMNYFLIKKKSKTIDGNENTILYGKPDSILIYPDSLMLIIDSDSLLEKISPEQYGKYKRAGMIELIGR